MRKGILSWTLGLGALALSLPVFGDPPSTELPIRLKVATFDPLRGEPAPASGLRQRPLEAGERGIYIVQFVGPIEETWKAALAAAGGELLEYVPEFAFKVRMTPAQSLAARRLPNVRWVGPFHPAYKLSPRLTRGAERLYVVRLEPGSDEALATTSIGGSGVRVVSREGRTLLVSASAERLEALAGVQDVSWIEDFVLRKKHNDKGGGVIMGAFAANSAGYDGSTQTVAIADTGLGGGTAATAHADIAASRIAAISNWPGTAGGCFQTIVNDGSRDVDTGHGTHVSVSALGDGTSTGKGKGTAPAARLVFQSVENYATISELCQLLYGYPNGYYLTGIPTDIRQLFQQAYTAGARVHSDSWGSDVAGQYTADSVNADQFVWSHRDLSITFSAGNAGIDAGGDGGVDGDSMGSPATAKNVISVGASENDRASDYACDASKNAVCANQGGQNDIFTWWEAWPFDFPAEPLKSDPSAGNAEQMAAFSSRGPTDDGRIKPDVVAPGTWVLSGYSDLYQGGYDPSPNPQTGLFQYDGWGYPLNDKLKYMGGTSMSNPLVAGGAAVVRDFYQKVDGHAASAALVKATLVNSAQDLLDEDNDGVNDNALPIPNFYEGWGRVDLAAATDGSREFVDEAVGLSTSGALSFSYDVAAGTPFKATLVWSDYPGTQAATKMLVNNLDLEVAGPGGVSYRGNVFGLGWSIAGGLRDNTNNVENVFVQSPAAGQWTVTVRGFNVPQGPQPFALVVAGQLGTPVPVTHDLTVAPPAHGTVTSADGFIICGTGGTACAHAYDEGALVNLSASPDPGYVFGSWTGDCTGATCSLTMSQDRSVGATFSAVAVTQPVVWTDAIGVTVTGNSLTKTASTAWGNAGAVSTQQIASGDGFVEFTASETNTYRMLGLSNGNNNASYADIDFAIYERPSGQIHVYESGTFKGSFGTYAAGNTLRVAVVGGVVKYSKNGVIFYTSTKTPIYPLLVDTALYTQGATLSSAVLSGASAPPPPSGSAPVVWTSAVGVTVTGNSLTKTAANAWGNAGAVSTQQIASGDGYVEFTASETNTYRMLGLSNGNTNASYEDIDFAIYERSSGQIQVYESGTLKGSFGSYAAGNTLRVAVVGGVVKYSKNGVVFYTSTKVPAYPLLVDAALYTQGATLSNAVIAGAP